MKPQTIGRVLGIGLRVAGRMAGQQMTAAARTQAAQPAANAPAADRGTGQAAGQVTRGVARGVRGFLRPFTRVGGILWLEVTGAFFFLFAAVFGSYLWRLRATWAQGQDHHKMIAAAAVMVVFLYLGVSSFWRARRK